MIKTFFIAIPALILFITGSFSDNGEKVIISQTIPAEIRAGEEFTVSLTINKPGISGFARLQQYLPEGFIAEEIDAREADFIFEENSVKFNWQKLPAEDSFTVIYKIKTDKDLTGKKMISGVFVFLENKKTLRQQIEPVEINVVVGGATPIARGIPVVERKIISVNPDKGEYHIELTIHPNNMNEAVHFKDAIPENYLAEIINVPGGTFSFDNNAVNLNWTRLPGVKEFVVTYKIHSGTSGPPPEINGELVYGDTTKVIETIVRHQEMPESEDLSVPSENNLVEVSSTEIITHLPEKNIVTQQQPVFIPVMQKGITYKIQISATMKSSEKDNAWFNDKYHIRSNVEVTMHEGWKKYLIGSFQSYKDATHFKKETRQKVSDAFIVAYDGATRISVADAKRNKSFNQ